MSMHWQSFTTSGELRTCTWAAIVAPVSAMTSAQDFPVLSRDSFDYILVAPKPGPLNWSTWLASLVLFLQCTCHSSAEGSKQHPRKVLKWPKKFALGPTLGLVCNAYLCLYLHSHLRKTLRAHTGGEMPPRPQAASDIYQLVVSAERPILSFLGNMHKVTTFIKSGGYACAIRRATRHKFGSSFSGT